MQAVGAATAGAGKSRWWCCCVLQTSGVKTSLRLRSTPQSLCQISLSMVARERVQAQAQASFPANGDLRGWGRRTASWLTRRQAVVGKHASWIGGQQFVWCDLLIWRRCDAMRSAERQPAQRGTAQHSEQQQQLPFRPWQEQCTPLHAQSISELESSNRTAVGWLLVNGAWLILTLASAYHSSPPNPTPSTATCTHIHIADLPVPLRI